ncbi:MAG: hypothetical protein IIW92_08780 [Lachnospiraceae bacterium]|nr:hypothetical protein [Lachnospiraceae bacterium]
MKKSNVSKNLVYKKILEKEPIYLQVARKYEKLHKNMTTSEETYLYVYAPVMVEFIQWILNTAINERRQRLYFLSRDGYQMYLAAKRLTKELDIPIECRYINVSRYALRVPEYHLIGEKCLDRICLGGIDVTFEKVMKRAGLNEEEAYHIATVCEYDKKYKEVLSYPEVVGLKEVLGKQKDFFDYVYKHSREAYDAAIGYLTQEGMCDSIDYAIVDSGWTGTMQQTLYNLIESTGKRPHMQGYYFGLYDIPKEENGLYLSYYFEPKKDIRRKVNFSNCLFEAVYTSPEGMTLRYKKIGDKYRPEYDSSQNPNKEMVEKHIKLITEYIDLYCDMIKECDILNKSSYRKKSIVEELLKNMMGTPSKKELETYGYILFSDDVLEGSLQNVAAELTDEDIKNQRFLRKAMIMLGLKKGIIHESAWIEGSIVRNGKKVKSYLRHARMYKYFVYLKKRFR